MPHLTQYAYLDSIIHNLLILPRSSRLFSNWVDSLMPTIAIPILLDDTHWTPAVPAMVSMVLTLSGSFRFCLPALVLVVTTWDDEWSRWVCRPAWAYFFFFGRTFNLVSGRQWIRACAVPHPLCLCEGRVEHDRAKWLPRRLQLERERFLR